MVKPWLHPAMTVSLLAVMALACVAPAAAQRVSLADRVAALEQRAADTSAAQSAASIELLNQLTQLRTEVSQLRGQLETLHQQTEALKSSVRTQTLDLDERLQVLEGANAPVAELVPDAAPDAAHVSPAPAPAPAGSAPVPAQAAASEPPNDDAAALAADPEQERAHYDAAFDALKSGRYSQAIQLFREFLGAFPDGAYAANACYWLGESYYVVEDYARAQAQFETLLARWPEHDKVPGALLKIGLSQHGQKRYDQAEATLREVEQRYPNTDAARIALDRLRTIELSRLN